ncbi:hypothetical protein Abr02nite_68850 [Paractinoplanes brasiliensis]|nr:hypothetical protein Abr02nite_68850 [Actinoplanes brasiliensis]
MICNKSAARRHRRRPEGSDRPSVSQQPAEQRNFVKVDKGNDPQTAKPEACHSFAPDTRVLMADGTTRPIAEVNVGDKVTTTDPSTGQSSDQQVTLLHANRDRELTDVTVSTAPAAAPRTEGEGKGGRSTRGPTESTLETTAHHPFWDATAGAWVDAAELTPGTSTLVGPDGQIQYVTAVHNFTGTEVMRDLTVATTHTYYVLAGTTPVLVHNNDAAFAGRACDVPRLGRSAERINGSLDPIARSQRDTVVMSTDNGPDLVASGVRDIDPRQRAAMGGSELEARLPGHHAEVTANERAKDLGLSPRALSSYPHAICPACRQYLEEEGYRISSDGMSAVMRTFGKEN